MSDLWVGLIVPQTNPTVEPELQRMVPPEEVVGYVARRRTQPIAQQQLCCSHQRVAMPMRAGRVACVQYQSLHLVG